MKYLIEPCCASRQVMLLRDAIGKDGTKEFEGYGDLSLTELLPAILTRYTETEMVIVAQTLPEQATEVIGKWMRQQWSRRDGRGKLDVIRHLTIVTSLNRRKSPTAFQWMKENPFGERLTLVDRLQEDTVILLPDFAVTGPVNMRYGERFAATATADPERIAALWEQYKPAGDTSGTVAEPETEEKPDAETPGTVAEPETGEKPDTEAPVVIEEGEGSSDE